MWKKAFFIVFFLLILAMIGFAAFWFYQNFIQVKNSESQPQQTNIVQTQNVNTNQQTAKPIDPEQTKQKTNLANLPGKIFGPQKSNHAKDLDAKKIIEWTNKYRQDEGLEALKENDLLIEASQSKVDDMFKNQYFDHVSPTGQTPAQLVSGTGYDYKLTGENLALGDFTDEKDLVDAWMASPGHRANILNNDYTEIGVSSYLNKYENRQTWISVQEFGRPMPKCPLPDKSILTLIEQDKNSITKLNEEITELSNEYKESIEQANAKIEQGNLAATNADKELAQEYWDEGTKLQQQGENKYKQAISKNQEIKVLNDSVNSLVKKYNNEVNDYNKCIQE